MASVQSGTPTRVAITLAAPRTVLTEPSGARLGIILPREDTDELPPRRRGMEGEQPPRPIFENIGEPERGYPLRFSTTDGIEIEVTELSTDTLDPSLFDVPAGFRQVETIRQEPAPPLVVRLKQTYDRLKRRRSFF